MDKLALSLTFGAIALGCFILMPDEMLGLANALYSIPPTPAWTEIKIDTNYTWPESSQTTLSAINYSDNLYIVSDGSINISITEYEP